MLGSKRSMIPKIKRQIYINGLVISFDVHHASMSIQVSNMNGKGVARARFGHSIPRGIS